MARNYHFKLARYGYTFEQLIRIVLRLAKRTGRPRLMWVNAKGRVHIIAEGANGYRHEFIADPVNRLHARCEWRMVGHIPPRDHHGAVVEVSPVFEGMRETPADWD